MEYTEILNGISEKLNAAVDIQTGIYVVVILIFCLLIAELVLINLFKR